MPEYVNGYEVFQLPCSRESGKTVSYAEFRNPTGPDGYRTQIMYGADTGLRRFVIPHEYLQGNAAAATITIDSVAMNRATYIRDLFERTKVSGRPFVIQCVENGQNYLVEFEESEQTLSRKLAAVYSTQIRLVQVRIRGVSVFDIAKVPGVYGWYEGDTYGDLGANVYNWTDKYGNGHIFRGDGSSGGIVPVADVHNGRGVMRCEDPGFFYLFGGGAPVIYEAFFLIKAREAAFTNFAGILTADETIAMLVGNNGDTRFLDQSGTFGDTFVYRKNGIEYPQDNQLAPMDTFGLVHVRLSTGLTLINPQINKDRDYVGRIGNIDYMAVVLMEALSPLSYAREIAEHLQIWGGV